MIDFSKFGLQNNPFRISPVINPEELIWVGMPRLKKSIDARIEASIRTSPSRIVLNWGRYGSGKTHAANFYTKTDCIKETFGVDTKNIKINLPRSSKEPVQAFLRALVGQLNFENIVDDFKKFKSIYKEQSEHIVEANTQDSIIAQFLQMFLGIQKSAPSLFSESQLLISKEAMKNFLYGDKSKSTLSSLNLPLGLDDDEQVVNLISGLFNTITYQKNIYKSVFLWIDEFEDIDTLAKTNQDRFTTFLRQLIDKTPNNLTIFLNFTLKGVGAFEDLSIILGEALASRARLFIEFDSPSNDEAKDYIKGLLNHPNFRVVQNIDNAFYPFTLPAVEEVLNHIGTLSIRRINETFSLALELALLSEPVPQEIGLDFMHSIKDEIPNWKV